MENSLESNFLSLCVFFSQFCLQPFLKIAQSTHKYDGESFTIVPGHFYYRRNLYYQHIFLPVIFAKIISRAVTSAANASHLSTVTKTDGSLSSKCNFFFPADGQSAARFTAAMIYDTKNRVGSEENISFRQSLFSRAFDLCDCLRSPPRSASEKQFTSARSGGHPSGVFSTVVTDPASCLFLFVTTKSPLSGL